MISQDQRISGYLSASAAVSCLDNTIFERIQDIQQTLRRRPARRRPGLQVSPALQCIKLYSNLYISHFADGDLTSVQACIRPPIESVETRELLLSVLGDRELTADKMYNNVKLVTI